ncbi:MAG: shikimate dehydrogenase [Bacteroidota bacterium]
MSATYGLIGYPLTHSFSPDYFAKKFAAEQIDASYTAFPLPNIKTFTKFLLSHNELRGLNVTIPYKSAIIPYLDDLSEAATTIGAVNCIDIRNGIKKGHNTDIIGFEKSLQPLLKSQHDRALILGSGGASLAVAYVLSKLGIPYTVVSRQHIHESVTYASLIESTIAENKLIINTTPLGTYPSINTAPPIPYSAISKQHLLYDLVYNPEETLFLKEGKKRGAIIKNGWEMLHIQAEASWEIWNSK